VNFGTILNSLTKSCVSMVVESKREEAKDLARNVIEFINIKEVLKKQFYIYHNLSSATISNEQDARLFVVEVLSTLNGHSFDDVKVYNALLETKFTPKKIKSTDLDFNISNLIKYKTTDGYDQQNYVECLSKVAQHVMEVKIKDDELSGLDEQIKHSTLRFLKPKHVIKLGLNKFNKKYSGLMDESDRKLFFLLKSKNDADINVYYNNLRENISREFNILGDDVFDDDLKDKVKRGIKEVSSGCNLDNILDAYELFHELRSLNEVDNER